MTIPATTRKAGPYSGTGVQTAWPFTFRVFAVADIAVTIVNSLGIETVLALGPDYTVALNANQETSPGGTVTYPVSGSPLPVGSRLAIVGDVDYDQPYDIPAGGNFAPLSLENQLDRTVMQVQQLRENLGRALQVPVTSPANALLPTPSPFDVLGWDATGSALVNVDPSDFLTIAGSSGFATQTFSGTGAQTAFTLSQNPGAIANLEVFIGGVRQSPTTDYTISGTTLTFTSAPPAGTNNILARWGQTLGIGVPADGSVTTEKLSTAVQTTLATVRNRNRFANGAFAFDQRNTAGAAVSISTGAETRTLDCVVGVGRPSGGVFTVQHITTGGPSGSPTYLRCRVTTVDASIPSSNAYWVRALLEGLDTADLGWGAAGALSVSISFRFRSSVAGGGVTFSGSVQNAAAGRSYPFSFPYPVANVWQEVKIENIPGDTTGTWPINNARSMQINFTLGAGTSTVGTANAWAPSDTLGVTGTTNLMDTLNATFDLGLLQVERGATCTPFEWVPYQTGLARVQRYYEKSYSFFTTPGTNVEAGIAISNPSDAAVSTYVSTGATFTVEKRAAPTMTIWDAAGNVGRMSTYTGGGLGRTDNANVLQGITGGTHSFYAFSLPGAGNFAAHHWVAAIEL